MGMPGARKCRKKIVVTVQCPNCYHLSIDISRCGYDTKHGTGTESLPGIIARCRHPSLPHNDLVISYLSTSLLI